MSCDAGGFGRLFPLVDSAAFLQPVALFVVETRQGQGKGLRSSLTRQSKSRVKKKLTLASFLLWKRLPTC